jgi:hypothetical protein
MLVDGSDKPCKGLGRKGAAAPPLPEGGDEVKLGEACPAMRLSPELTTQYPGRPPGGLLGLALFGPGYLRASGDGQRQA